MHKRELEDAEEVLLPLTGASCAALRYRAAALEGIRRHAVDKFLSIPRGGLEVGGLLLGRVEGDTVELLDSEEFAVEYSAGPSYRFSPADEAKLRERLQGPDQVLGWWHSHTRSEIDLSEEDLRIHKEFFPAAQAIALIIKPFKFDPAQVAVYLPNGGSGPFAPSARFVLDGPKVRTREPAPAPVVAPMVPRPARVSRGRRGRLLGAIAAAVAVACAAAWMAVPRTTVTPVPAPIGLSLSDAGDQLTVRWDRTAEAIRSSVGGELIVVDGDSMTRIPLGVDSLNGGTLAYVRRSGNVEVRLRARSRDNELHETVAHFAGPAPKTAPAPQPAPEPADVQRMRAEMERLNSEIAQMRTPAVPAPVTPRAAPAARAVSGPAAPVTRAPAAMPSWTMQPPPPAIALSPAVAPGVPALSQVQVPPAPLLSRGQAIWTGSLPRGATLSFDGRRPSAGAVTGRLPDGPSRLRVYPGDLREAGIVVYTESGKERIEAPSAANGWNRTTYKPDSKRARDVAVLETPGPSNNWQRLQIRSEQRPISVLVLEWEEVAR